MRLWPHLAFILACTLAAGRFTERPDANVCGRDDPCHSVHELATVHSALIPLALYFCFCVMVYVPSLLLASRTRLAQLQEATMLVSGLGPVLVLIWRMQGTRPALAYALSAHWVLGLFCRTALVTPVVGAPFQACLAWAGGLSLLVYAWGFGPPLPVVDSPVASHCCGAATHLMGLAVASVGLPAYALVVQQIVQHEIY